MALNLIEDLGFPPDIPPSTQIGAGTTAGITVNRVGSGQYHVTFPVDVSACVGVGNAQTAGASLNIQMGTPDNNQATVFTFNFNGGSINIFSVSFYMLVSC